jgi:glutamate-1-semialdehyde 2,1-aminomutase
VESVFEQYPKKIAAVIVEPVAANMGVVPPLPGFLEGLRRLTKEFGTVLIFDEVITGFRLAYGGAQSVYRVKPDLTCLGKIIGGGLPVGAYGGRGDIMEMVAPLGPVYQAGTLSGNPLAMTAGIEVLKALSRQDVYRRLEDRASALEAGIAASVAKRGTVARVSRLGSLLTVFFTRERVVDYESARRADTALFGRFFHNMLAGGIYWPPSQFEAAFVSAAYSDEDIQVTIDAADRALSFTH